MGPSGVFRMCEMGVPTRTGDNVTLLMNAKILMFWKKKWQKQHHQKLGSAERGSGARAPYIHP